MTALAITLQVLWILTLFCAGYGVGWLLANAVINMRMPIFAALGVAVMWLILTFFMGQDVVNAIEHLTGT